MSNCYRVDNYVNRFLIPVMNVCNYIPAISSIVNLIHLIQKIDIYHMQCKGKMRNSLYIDYIKQKNTNICLILIIPVIGNLILVCFYTFKFFNKKNKISDGNKKIRSLVNHPAPTATSSDHSTVRGGGSSTIGGQEEEDMISLWQNEGEWFDPSILEFEEFAHLKEKASVKQFLSAHYPRYRENFSDCLDETALPYAF